MADSIRPWLAEYLIDIGERVGGNLSSAPHHEKKKKVQLVEFLTYGLASQDDCLWARVSDKRHKIPVRFSRMAVTEYTRLNSKRLTEHKTAVVAIKDFNVFFGRVPLPNSRGMSEKPCLALEIDHVSVIGSIGEGQWGNPQDVETNDDLRQWSEGLRQHGGGCNVLMEKKKLREQKPDANVGNGHPQDKKRDALPVAPAPKKRNGTRAGSKAPDSNIVYKTVPEKVDLLKEYQRSWRPIIGNPAMYASKPNPSKEAATKTSATGDPVSPSKNAATTDSAPRQAVTSAGSGTGKTGAHVLDLGSQSPRDPSPIVAPDPKLQTTPAPEEWPASPSVSPFVSKSDEAASQGCKQEPLSPVAGSLKIEADTALSNSQPSFDPMLPTPAQRLQAEMQDAFPSPPASSPARSSVSPSPLPPPTSTPFSLPFSQLQALPQVVRKVPYPVAPPPPSSPLNGTPRILAPNSDTSGASQSQLRSQSRSQQLPSHTQLSSGNPCLTQESLLQDRGDELSVQSFLFTQLDCYDGDQSFLEPNSEVMDRSDFHGLFTLPEGGDTGISLPDATDNSQDFATGSEDEDVEAKNNEEQEADESYRRVHNESSDSVVPDSQGDQLDDDDAQIENSLFGRTQSYVANGSTTAIDPKSVIGASVPHELSSFVGIHQNADEHTELPSGKRLSDISVERPPTLTVSEHDPITWRFPAFMRDTNGKKAKGKQKETALDVSGEKNGQTTPVGRDSSRSTSATRITMEKPVMGERTRRQSPSSGNKHAIPSPSGVAKVGPVPFVFGRDQGPTVGIPKIDLRTVAQNARKRSRLSGNSFDLDGMVEGSVRKKRRIRDSLSFEIEPASRWSIGHGQQDSGGTTRDGADGEHGMTVSVEARKKLKESASNFGKYRSNLPSSAHYNADEPPWISWQKVTDILLRTGRHRDKQLKQKKTKAEDDRKI